MIDLAGKGTVCVIGLGYVGLPLACLLAKKGFKVRGYDKSKAKTEQINKGNSPISDGFLEKELRKRFKKIEATTSPKNAINCADIVVVCVPTPVTKSNRPDLSCVKHACRDIANFLRKGMLVVIESTVYPGVTDEEIKPLLEKNGLIAGKDFGLVHCPERLNPGDKKFSLEKIPRVVGGINGKWTRKAKKFYGSFLDAEVAVLSSLQAAEAVKIMENAFRDVNIAFVNEMAMSFDSLGIDISEVIRGAKTKPFGFMPFYPGPGVGGHCIPVDPYYLIERARRKGFDHRFVALAREVNNSMPKYVVGVAENLLKALGLNLKGSKITLLGLAYKPEIDDSRGSPSLEILRLLKKKGAKTRAFDPFLPKLSNSKNLGKAVKGADCVVLATNHKAFQEKLTPSYLKSNRVKSVVDCRNCLDAEGIKAKGIVYRGIGR